MKRSSYVIGDGKERYEFPIVRNGNVRTRVAKLYVNAISFPMALGLALNWALDYSLSKGVSFWPLVRYKSIGGMTRAYVRRIDGGFVYVEGKDFGYWLHSVLLEAIA